MKMGRDFELTDEQYDTIHKTLPKIADLALIYLVSHLPRDGFFDGWAGGIVAAGDTSSWGDEAMGCALVDVDEKYEKFVLQLSSAHNKKSAEIRGAILRAGSLLIAVSNKLTPEKDVVQAIAVGVEKYLEARAKLAEELEIHIPE